MANTNNFKIKCLYQNDVDLMVELQQIILDEVKEKGKEGLFRENTRGMFELCVQSPNHSVGIFDGDKMIALGILFDGLGTDEDLSTDLVKHDVRGKVSRRYKSTDLKDKTIQHISANMKLTLVHPDYRGMGLQIMLLNKLEALAKFFGYTHLCCTISPDNAPSISNVEKCGYEFDHKALKYGGLTRNIYVKEITGSYMY